MSENINVYSFRESYLKFMKDENFPKIFNKSSL